MEREREAAPRGPKARIESALKGKDFRMSRVIQLILFIFLIFLLIGMLPVWPYSGSWGYYPSGGFGLLLLILIIAFLVGERGSAAPPRI